MFGRLAHELEPIIWSQRRAMSQRHLTTFPLCTENPRAYHFWPRSPSTNRKYPPLPVDKLEEEINRRMADDNKLFQREEFSVSSLLRLVYQQGEGGPPTVKPFE